MQSDFKTFYNKYFQSLEKLASKYLGSLEAKDIVQTVFIKLFSLMDEQKDRSDKEVLKFVKVMTENESKNCLKYNKRILRKRQEYGYYLNSRNAGSDQAEGLSIKELVIIKSLIMDAIEKLPPKSRAYIKMKMDGKSVKEIATAYGVSEKTVRNSFPNSSNHIRKIIGQNIDSTKK